MIEFELNSREPFQLEMDCFISSLICFFLEKEHLTRYINLESNLYQKNCSACESYSKLNLIDADLAINHIKLSLITTLDR